MADGTVWMPPEWHPQDWIWIGFPHLAEEWPGWLGPAQEQMAAFASAVAESGQEVRLLVRDEANEARARALASSKVTLERRTYGDVWLRDTGPILVAEAGGPLALDYKGNGWGGKYPSPLDDDLARVLCAQAGLERSARDWVLEGGAIEVDGAGLCVTTGQCLLNPNRNPLLSRRDIEERLKVDLGLKEVLWLGVGLLNDHTDGHVDNLARFVAPGVLALPEPFGEDDPNVAVFADALARAKDWPVEIVTIPSAGLHLDEDGEAIPASHMNFYIGNAAVVVPTYGGPSDDKAVAAIASLFPDRETLGLPATHILTGGGSFHCISQQVPTL